MSRPSTAASDKEAYRMRAVLIINPVSGDDEPNEEKVPRFRRG